MTPRVLRIVHGDDLLYRFFQEALRSEPELFAAVPQMLVRTLAIWMPLETYKEWPVLLPWVVRDPRCRGNARKGVADEWSAPDERGYLRDDNSLVKSLPRALQVRGPRGSHVHGARMGSEFVASHIWREVCAERLASRIPLLNSFLPNLVWLPGQIAKLSDREGGVIQQTLQATAWGIYRNAPVTAHLRPVAEEAWSLIPEPEVSVGDVDLASLNWFVPTPGFYRTRLARLQSVVAALQAIDEGQTLPDRVVTTRYAAGLPTVAPSARADLRSFLGRFIDGTA